jgi:hypothetical protein
MPSDVRSGGSHLGFGAGVGAGYVPPEHKPSTIRGSYMHMEMSGVEYGLNKLMEFDSESPMFPTYDNSANPLNGNSRETPNPYKDDAYAVSEKGHDFSVC